MPREPRDPNVETEATVDNLKELAWAYQPIMRYADSEHFFPALAESWLTHTTSAPWDAAEVEADDLPLDPGRHGTTIARADQGVTSVTRMGGPPNAEDRPIQLSSANDGDAIGKYAGSNGTDAFLAFGGWMPGEGFRTGNRDYDYAAFSELSAAVNPRREWNLIEGEAHLPHIWVPQPPTPTVYAEVEWGGKFTAWTQELNPSGPALPRTSTPLDDYLVITYQYLYAVREPAPGQSGPRKLEGQWEAISVFFKGRRERTVGADGELDDGLDDTGRPVRFFFKEPPPFVAYSQGLAPAEPVAHRAEVRGWETAVVDEETFETVYGVYKIGTHPIAFVGSGTHRNLFNPAGDVPWSPGGRGWTGINYDPGAEVPGVEMAAGWAAAGVAASVAASAAAAALLPLAPLLAIALAVVAVLLILAAIVLLVLWVISIFIESADQASGDPLPEWEDVDETGDRGSPESGASETPPMAGTGSESPAGAPGSPGAAPMAPGVANTGSPEGFNTVDFDLRVVNMWQSERRTNYPAGEKTEYPHWWDYTGRWGVRVTPALANDWEDGTRRVDEFRRSWGYWNSYWLLDFWSRPGYPGP